MEKLQSEVSNPERKRGTACKVKISYQTENQLLKFLTSAYFTHVSVFILRKLKESNCVYYTQVVISAISRR